MNIKNPIETWNVMQKDKINYLYKSGSENRAVPDFTLENMLLGEV